MTDCAVSHCSYLHSDCGAGVQLTLPTAASPSRTSFTLLLGLAVFAAADAIVCDALDPTGTLVDGTIQRGC